jgi:hypothetical protein
MSLFRYHKRLRIRNSSAIRRVCLAAAKRMLLPRCEMREEGEKQFRSIREPLDARSRLQQE